ncbi:MAG TPA: hypothetical protein VH370_05965 [Humisphaera sp.]|jgi:hypothetical protein|nr:hypothetical protein [Humisphaera sp.]
MTRLADIQADSLTISPLEAFVREYVEARDGVWDQIEPQVYDLMVGSDIKRVAFDPEALPEHPEAQLASLGSPLIDKLLEDAQQRWRLARFYLAGANLHPRDLETRVARALSFTPPATLSIERVRAMDFPQAVFWFKATFASDQKEEQIVPTAIDLHYLRGVRNLDALLAAGRLSKEPAHHLPEARHATLEAGYRAARRQVAPTVSALANGRRREWEQRAQKQIARMSAYYAQLRAEAEDRAQRETDSDKAKAAERLAAIDREEQLRIAELRRKSALRVHASLISAAIVQQPKLLISAAITPKGLPARNLEIVWDAMNESVEAVPCPSCGRPTFSFQISRTGMGCDVCRGGRQS